MKKRKSKKQQDNSMALMIAILVVGVLLGYVLSTPNINMQTQSATVVNSELLQ